MRSKLRLMAEYPVSIGCPFTGGAVDIRKTADGLLWYGVVESPYGGYSTSLFQTKEKLLFFLGHDGGVPPGYPEVPKIEVTERLPPPVTNDAEEAEKDRSLEDASNEFAERTMFERAGRGGAGVGKKSVARRSR